jgi:hypothetical protein
MQGATIANLLSNPYRLNVDDMTMYPVSKMLAEYDGVLVVRLSATKEFSWFPDADKYLAYVFRLGDDVGFGVFAIDVPVSLRGKEVAAIVPDDETAAAFISVHGVGARDAYFLTPHFCAAVEICNCLLTG